MGTPELDAEDIGTVLIVCTGNVDAYGQDSPAYDAMADQVMDVLPWVGWVLTGGGRPAVAPAAAG